MIDPDKTKAYFRKRYEDRLSSGLCAHCDNPVIPGQTQCQTCVEKSHARWAKRKMERQANGEPMRHDAEAMKIYYKERHDRLRSEGLCIVCGKRPVLRHGDARCPDCADKNRDQRKIMRQLQKEMGICTSCGTRTAMDGKALCRTCSESRIGYNRRHGLQYRAKLKEEAFAVYGGKCQCCGESDIRFLTIDHINNDGAEHRRALGHNVNIHLWLKKNDYPDGFQVLCFNCNCGKAQNGGVCPHKETNSD